MSDFSPSNIGVRQGENLSPLLFSLYLNDIKEYFIRNSNTRGIVINNEDNVNELYNLLKIFILLYADDTVILAETADDLREALNTYERYCDMWKLTVNTSKTKIVVFSKSRNNQYNFSYKNEPIDVVEEYKYLGVMFHKNGSFTKSKSYIAQQATRAVYSLIRNANRLNLPIDLQIDIFNKTIKPILLYGAETWGFGNLDVIDRVQLMFLKHILKLKRSTANYFIYGETGCLPVSIEVEERVMSFWSRLILSENGDTPNKLSHIVYINILNKTTHLNDNELKRKYPWFHKVKSILYKCGFINVWNDQTFPNSKWLKLAIKRKLSDLFLNEWYSLVNYSSNSSFYKVFKQSFGIEDYLSYTPNASVFNFLKFRTRNHRLPIVTGSWGRNPIPLNDRKCEYCNDKLGDEFHYLFECEKFANERVQYIKPYFFRRPTMFKVEQLFTKKDSPTFHKLCKFLMIIIRNIRT